MSSDIRFDVRDNVRETLRKFQRSVQAEIDTALPRALNKTAATVRTEVTRRLKPLYPGMLSRTLRKQTRIQRATKQRPTAVVVVSGSRFRLFGNFGVRTFREPRYHGVGIRPGTRLPPHMMTPDGREVTADDLRRVFLQRSRNGDRPNFWVREGKARMPINVVLVRGLAVAFVEEKIGEALQGVAQARFLKALEQELKFLAGKNG